MNIQSLLAWWNLVYLAPFFLALLYLGVYTLSGVTFGDPDADMEADAHLETEAHFDADADADVDADADADTHMDADADHDAESSTETGHASAAFVPAALDWIGVGRVPLSIVLMVLLLTWGVTGFIVNQLLGPMFPRAWEVATASLPLAAAVSLTLTHGVAALVTRCLPMNETTARRRHELLGALGTAVFPIDERFGMASVRDQDGDLYQIPCRVEAGTATPTIPKGARVRLTAYNARQSLFSVVPAEETSDPRRP